jgi:hypothetical protein
VTDPDPVDAFRAGIVELDGEHREVVVVTERLEQGSVAAADPVGAQDPVVEDGDAHDG